MSFSGTVKEELAKQKLGARHCQIAEMAAIIRMCGGVSVSRNDRFLLKIQTENLFVARKYFTLLQKTFIIEVELSVRQHHGKKSGRTYHLYVKKHGDVLQILRETGIMKPDGISYMDIAEDFELTETELLRRTCCRRAFLRGAFLAAGSITNPEKSYHLEFACTMEYHAEQIRKVLRSFGIEAGMVQRKKYYVVYIKEGDGIVDVLNIMAAHQALMELENIRILKDMRNSLNRKVNCEAANIYKTVNGIFRIRLALKNYRKVWQIWRKSGWRIPMQH